MSDFDQWSTVNGQSLTRYDRDIHIS